jgi:metal-responsive CopG/Arc/MetJ family transcriptional regulator
MWWSRAMPQRIVTFKIEESLLEALDAYAQRKGLTRSEVIRDAIERMLQSEGVEIRRREEKPDPRSLVIEITI